MSGAVVTFCHACRRIDTDTFISCETCKAKWCESCKEMCRLFKYGDHAYCNACRNPKSPEIPDRTLLGFTLKECGSTYNKVLENYRKKNPEQLEVPDRSLLYYLLIQCKWPYNNIVRRFYATNPTYARSAHLWECTQKEYHEDCNSHCKTLTKSFWVDGEKLPVKGLCCKVKHPRDDNRWCHSCASRKKAKSDVSTTKIK